MSRHRKRPGKPGGNRPAGAKGGDSRPDTPHERAIDRVRRTLVERGAPRLQMTFIVAGTGLSGLAASVLLRELGLRHMGFRYGLSVVIAYGAFLALLGTWLRWQRGRARRGKPSVFSRIPVPDVSLDLMGSGGGGRPSGGGGGWGGFARGGGVPRWSGGGGRAGGAGASAIFEAPPTTSPLQASAPAAHSSGGSGFGGRIGDGISDAVSGVLDTDEVVAIVLTLAAIFSAIVAAGWVVYSAPILLADVLVDGALSAGLYRRLRRTQGHTWWEGAVRRTIVPAVVVLVAFVAAGFAIHGAWPEAATLGDAWRTVRSR